MDYGVAWIVTSNCLSIMTSFCYLIQIFFRSHIERIHGQMSFPMNAIFVEKLMINGSMSSLSCMLKIGQTNLDVRLVKGLLGRVQNGQMHMISKFDD